jgi:hypothetical protein
LPGFVHLVAYIWHAAGGEPFGELAPSFQQQVATLGIPPANRVPVVNAEYSRAGPPASDIGALPMHMQCASDGCAARSCRNWPTSPGSSPR